MKRRSHRRIQCLRVTCSHSLTRDAYRRSLVTGIESFVGSNVIESLVYSYDALNRPTVRNTDSFGYDDRSEVTSANITGISNAYGYDEIGNSTFFTPNNINQYTEFTYDLDGNLLDDGVRTFTYDAANRLKTVSTNGVIALTNFYDAKSRRVRKVTPEAATTFFYDGWNLIRETIVPTDCPQTTNDYPQTTIDYYWGKDLSGTLQGAGGVGGLLYLTVDGTIYIPFYDNNGNITRYLDANGNTVAQYTYDAFENTISQSGPLAGFFRHRFSTKYYDGETGLYYYGYRFYHPTLMRWLNRDPIEEDGGLNAYAFCDNTPIVVHDKHGLFTIYVHTDGLAGHVGISNKEGITFDYGRYHGKYTTGLLGKATYSGPNILVKGQGLDGKHTYTCFHFSVCPLVDEKVSEVLDEKFASGLRYLPAEVIARYDKKPDPLSASKRYMGSDWTPNNNCMTFTFNVVATAAGKVGKDNRATQVERRQAMAMVSLSFLSCWHLTPSHIKATLSNFAKKNNWITEEGL